jgi:hypothetical protein
VRPAPGHPSRVVEHRSTIGTNQSCRQFVRNSSSRSSSTRHPRETHGGNHLQLRHFPHLHRLLTCTTLVHMEGLGPGLLVGVLMIVCYCLHFMDNQNFTSKASCRACSKLAPVAAAKHLKPARLRVSQFLSKTMTKCSESCCAHSYTHSYTLCIICNSILPCCPGATASITFPRNCRARSRIIPPLNQDGGLTQLYSCKKSCTNTDRNLTGGTDWQN